MSLNLQSIRAAVAPAAEFAVADVDRGETASFVETVVTVVSATIAVLVVAIMAVLMGLA